MSTAETELISRAQRGDVASFEELIKAHQARLFRLLMAVAGNRDDAEDSLQEALLHAYKALPAFRGDCTFGTWLHRIALNAARNWVRAQTRSSSEHTAQRLPLSPPHSAGPEEAVLEREKTEAVRRTLLGLPPHYRDVVLLRHYQDMSYEDIAVTLQVPVGTVRSRLAQARATMARTLGPAISSSVRSGR